ncbi:histidine phosphatase family protein [Simkania negevensis]|uniref:Histidine phosphatase family protein n=1 Tax=Simkania negevensis TaxID=83561 RepID=A0ABS3APW6_9BACT|nr:histidine phosphatase family protein [Simkania negevensis]
MAVTVVLIRHAQPAEGSSGGDALRPLTKEGVKIQRRMSAYIEGHDLVPDVILTSPLLRAKQTAELLQETFKVEPIEETALAENSDVEQLSSIIQAFGEGLTLFLVGHVPSLPALADALLGEAYFDGRMEKSSTIVLYFEGAIDFGAAEFVNYFKPSDVV